MQQGVNDVGIETRYEFNEVTLLSSFAVGTPGKRTFFLLIGRKEKWVRVWLEKYLLETLALAIDQFLFNLSREFPSLERREMGAALPDDVPKGLPTAELEIDQISLGFEQERATLNMIVHSSGPQRTDGIELHCRATLTQLRKLGAQAKSVCAAGRPICVICGGPIDPSGHICPGSN